MATPVVVIAGDGIGPEVTAAMQAVVQAAGANLTWVEGWAGLHAAERFGDPLPAATLDLIRRYRVALKGPCTTPVGKGYRSINVRLRKELEIKSLLSRCHTLDCTCCILTATSGDLDSIVELGLKNGSISIQVEAA